MNCGGSIVCGPFIAAPGNLGYRGCPMATVHEQTSDAAAWKPRSTLLGALLVHRYRITQLIGQGSTGAVYRADDVQQNRPVAVRILVPALSQNLPLISRIRARIDEHARIEQQHPGALVNLVDAFDVGITLEGEVFVVTDFLDGDHLSTMLVRGGRLPWVRARTLFVRLAQLIHDLHGHGIVLGTLQARHCYAVRNRPKHEAIKILNTALIEHAAWNLGPAAGEAGVAIARYASPERLCGEPIDPRSDVYSFGVIAYELLTGRVPFVGTNAIRLAAMHLQTPPLPPRQVAPDAQIPAAVEDILLKALAKAPADRFPGMDAFVAALSAVPEQEPVAAPYPGIAPIAAPSPVSPVSPLAPLKTPAPPPVAPPTLAPPTLAPPKIAPSVVMRAAPPAPTVEPAPPPAPPLVTPPRRPPSLPVPAAVLPSLRKLSGPTFAAAPAPADRTPETAAIDRPPAAAAPAGSPEPAAPATAPAVADSREESASPPAPADSLKLVVPGAAPALADSFKAPASAPTTTPSAAPALADSLKDPAAPVLADSLKPSAAPVPADSLKDASAPADSLTPPVASAAAPALADSFKDASAPAPADGLTPAATTPASASAPALADIHKPADTSELAHADGPRPAATPVLADRFKPAATPAPAGAAATDGDRAAPPDSADSKPADEPADSADKPTPKPAEPRELRPAPVSRDPVLVMPPLVAAGAPARPAPARDELAARRVATAAPLSSAPGPGSKDELAARRPTEVNADDLRAAALRQSSSDQHPSLSQISDTTDSIIAELPRRRIPWVAVVGFGAALAAGAAAYIQTQPPENPPDGRAIAQQQPPTSIQPRITAPEGPAGTPPDAVAVAPEPGAEAARDAALEKLAEAPPSPEQPPASAVAEPRTTPTDPPAEPSTKKRPAKSEPATEPKKKKSRSKAAPEEEEEDVFDQLRKHMEAKKAAEEARAAAAAAPPPPAAPAPKIDSDSAAKAKDALERARQAATQGNHALAYSLAKQSYGLVKTTDALEMMGLSACKAGNADNARAAANQLAGSRRSAIVDACAKSGITL